MSTKPYISGSNYLIKTSDYAKGDWEEVWDALFWSFMDNHRAFFLKNPRLRILVWTFDKLDEGKSSECMKRVLIISLLLINGVLNAQINSKITDSDGRTIIYHHT